jgi:hypothetical protein
MSDFKDIKAGDTVWLENRGYRASGELIESVVNRVGRDYFYASCTYRQRKFHKDGGWEFVGTNDNGHYKWRAWRYKEQYERQQEEQVARDKVQAFFRDYSKPRQLTLQQLAAIINIIEP